MNVSAFIEAIKGVERPKKEGRGEALSATAVALANPNLMSIIGAAGAQYFAANLREYAIREEQVFQICALLNCSPEAASGAIDEYGFGSVYGVAARNGRLLGGDEE